jgi:hypothetical protein
MSHDPNPNWVLIRTIQGAISAGRIYSIAHTAGLHLAIEIVSEIIGVSTGSDYDKACLVEFCNRHGGMTGTNARRFAFECLGGQHTNRCSNCGAIGHNKNHCNK